MPSGCLGDAKEMLRGWLGDARTHPLSEIREESTLLICMTGVGELTPLQQ